MLLPGNDYRAILFDLFDTLVLFHPQKLPTVMRHGRQVRSTAPISFPVFHRYYPAIPFARYQEALIAVSREIAQEKEETLREIPSTERFRRLFARLGIPENRETVRQREAVLSTHMHTLQQATGCPTCHRDLLAQLRARGYRLGLLSNFDHAPTARQLLHRYGLAPLFDVIAISVELGWRKPKAETFLHVVEALGIRPEEGVFVGDNWKEDILGAAAVGLTPVWINRKGQPVPAERPASLHVIRSLGELLS
ncbi:MAG: HAD family hydrolase [Nitrospinota bacterium]|nr:MAG: HAD family hydrolase [Nitrospinota bacterium]